MWGIDERAGEAAESKYAQPDQQDALSSEAVAQAAGRKNESSEHQAVRVDDPLEVRRRGSELANEAGQCHVHDRDVDVDDQRCQTEREKDGPFALRRFGRDVADPQAVRVLHARLHLFPLSDER